MWFLYTSFLIFKKFSETRDHNWTTPSYIYVGCVTSLEGHYKWQRYTSPNWGVGGEGSHGSCGRPLRTSPMFNTYVGWGYTDSGLAVNTWECYSPPPPHPGLGGALLHHMSCCNACKHLCRMGYTDSCLSLVTWHATNKVILIFAHFL
jgi:hypothetical protein